MTIAKRESCPGLRVKSMSNKTECDSVIISAGSVGCMHANRLPADRRTEVLLTQADCRDQVLALKSGRVQGVDAAINAVTGSEVINSRAKLSQPSRRALQMQA